LSDVRTAKDNDKIVIFNKLSQLTRLTSPTQSLEYAMDGLQLAEQIKDRAAIAEGVDNMGEIYFNWGKYEKALDYYQRSLGLYEQIGNTQGLATTTGNIAVIFAKLGAYDKALANFEKILRIEQSLSNFEKITEALNNIGLVYTYQENDEIALEYFLNAYKLSNANKIQMGLGNTLVNIGNVYFRHQSFDKASDTYNKALEVFREQNDKLGIAQTLCNLGLVLKNKINYKDALQLFFESLQIAQSIGSMDKAMSAYQFISQTYSLMGQTQKAFDYYKLFVSVKDSAFSAETSTQISNLELKYEAEKRQQQLDLLKNVKENEHSLRKNLQYAIMAGGAVCVIFALIIFYNGVLNRRSRRLLAEQNFVIIEKEKQLNHMIHELTHKGEELQRLQKALEKEVS